MPEGCPLAVPAMILFTYAITNFAASRGHRLTSYVDNWAVQTHSSRSVMDFLQVAHAAASSLKLILNPDKTRAYSTTAAGRSFLRSVSFQGFPLQVALKLSDLGVTSTAAHKQFQSNYWSASTQQNQNCGVCELCLGHIPERLRYC